MNRKKKLLCKSMAAGGVLFLVLMIFHITTTYGSNEKTDENPYIRLKNGRYERWIDRIEIPEWGHGFYRMLEEGTDGDGYGDYFIADKYFSGTGENGNRLTVATITYPDKETAKADYRKVYAAIRTIYDAFDRDHPEVFWLSGTTASTITVKEHPDETCTYTFFFVVQGIVNGREIDIRNPEYRSEKAIRQGMRMRDELVEEIAQKVRMMHVADAVAYLNDSLTQRNSYLTKEGTYPPDSVECLGALEGTKGSEGPVCEGYARAFKVLCDKVGIPCVLEDGQAATSATGRASKHMWNAVKIQNKWYGVDVTWNDPVSKNTESCSGRECKNWLLLGTNTKVKENWTYAQSHIVENAATKNGFSFSNGPLLAEDAYDFSGIEEKETIANKGEGKFRVDFLTAAVCSMFASLTVLYYNKLRL